MPNAQIHVYPSQPVPQGISQHDEAAEADLLAKLHASGVIALHQVCPAGIPCTTAPGGVALQESGGLVAPGIKLYPHRKKWQDSSMRVYNEEDEDQDEENA